MSHATPFEDVADGIRRGDPAAFERFLKGQWGALVRFVLGYVETLDDAEDLAQEAFVRLWAQREQVRPGCLRAYLYRIARNLALNERRTLAVHRRIENGGLPEPPPSPTPDLELEAGELRALVRGAVDGLPERRREAFVLAHFQDLSHAEIAHLMEISPQTVANQISAALATLRQALGPILDRELAGRLRRSG